MTISSIPPTSFAAITGSESAPDTSLPGTLEITGKDALKALNPLQHVPVVGMIYRAATGDTIPAPLRVAGAGIVGGPLGMVGAAFMGLLEELCRMGPDLSRPATPAGMAQTGSEAGVEPVTPGTAAPDAYTTLATTTPDFLGGPAPGAVGDGPPNTAIVQNGAAAYRNAALEWERSQAVEKGLA